MRQLVRYLLLATIALLLACVSPNSGMRKLSPQHLGFTFPAVVADLYLQNFHIYEDPNLGAVANYRLSPADPLLVSVYIFPIPRYPDGTAMRIEEHAREELAGLLHHYEGSRQIEWPKEIEYSNRAGRAMHQAAIEINHPDIEQAYSILALASEGAARLKFRISYPGEDLDATYAIRRFLEQFP